MLSSEVQCKALLKVLKETHVPTVITDSFFKGMLSLVLATNQVSFLDDELPPEGRDHTLVMHIVVKCEDMIVVRVLIDNGSTLNVCLMAILKCLKVDISLIRLSTMIIRAFDGMRHEVQGEIELMIKIDPRSFMVNFQVIKVDSPYNVLSGRPWLHAASAIASTLHQRLKFIFENKSITIMAEKPITIFQETSISYIDANAFPKVSFHRFELVSMIHNALEPKSSCTTIVLMAVKEMLKFGYKLGQSLEVVGCGSLALIELLDNKGRFGLGYEATHEELFQDSIGKKRKHVAPRMSIPHNRATFWALAKVIMLEPFKELEDEESDLACIIRLCLENFFMNAIISFEDDLTSTI